MERGLKFYGKAEELLKQVSKIKFMNKLSAAYCGLATTVGAVAGIMTGSNIIRNFTEMNTFQIVTNSITTLSGCAMAVVGTIGAQKAIKMIQQLKEREDQIKEMIELGKEIENSGLVMETSIAISNQIAEFNCKTPDKASYSVMAYVRKEIEIAEEIDEDGQAKYRYNMAKRLDDGNVEVVRDEITEEQYYTLADLMYGEEEKAILAGMLKEELGEDADYEKLTLTELNNIANDLGIEIDSL